MWLAVSKVEVDVAVRLRCGGVAGSGVRDPPRLGHGGTRGTSQKCDVFIIVTSSPDMID